MINEERDGRGQSERKECENSEWELKRSCGVSCLIFSRVLFYNGYSSIVGTSNVLVASKILAPGFNSILACVG